MKILIAAALITIEKTFGTCRMRVLEKMQVTRSAKLIRCAVQKNLIV